MTANRRHRGNGQNRPSHRPNTLGLGDRELNELIDEFVSPKEPSVFERVFARWPFPTTSVPVKVLHPGGTEVELRLAAAIFWYSRGMLSQERAAQLAGMDRTDFILALAREEVDAFVVDMRSLREELANGE